jgi:hypothetical protein
MKRSEYFSVMVVIFRGFAFTVCAEGIKFPKQSDIGKRNRSKKQKIVNKKLNKEFQNSELARESGFRKP